MVDLNANDIDMGHTDHRRHAARSMGITTEL